MKRMWTLLSALMVLVAIEIYSQSGRGSEHVPKAKTEVKPTPEPTEENDELELDEWYASSPDNALRAVARIIPDEVYLQRHDLDSVAVAIFRYGPSPELKESPQVVARHDFPGRTIAHIQWSPDSKFLLFTTFSSGGHSPSYNPAFLFSVSDNSFREVDAAIGSVVSPKFRFEPPDIAIMEVKRGETLEEEVKVSLTKAEDRMPRVK